MKKLAIINIGLLLLLSTSAMANSVMDNHLSTAGDKSAAASHVLTQPNNVEMSILDMQLKTSGDKSMAAGHQVNSQLNDNSESVFEYHYKTAN
ncbi:hypothetical protein L4D09_25030 [Photobacterium makurazakiensis]|uniref:hypothetical protein n=1 Tax=Photobacterium makurazakiensis TaxID=2910234 RepID=UPI003D0D7BFA